jgi:hypothetical protein
VSAPPWPAELALVAERSITVEFSTLTRAGGPVTSPTTPYPGDSGHTVDVSTGLTYPAKAERARRDPRVALLFADPVGNPGAPVVAVQGLATVRDADLQANTDRYVALSSSKLPETTKGRPKAVLRRMGWYYARIWIEVTPVHVWWWPTRELSEPASQWHAPEGTAAPLSDPAPSGAPPPPWRRPPSDWRELAARALDRLPWRDLTVVAPNGFPLCLPLSHATLADGRIALDLGPGAPELAAGPACLTLHGHPARFTAQENHTLVGTLDVGRDGPALVVERALGDWSAAGGWLRMGLGFLAKGRVLGPRLRQEAARRHQPVPKVRFSGRGDEAGQRARSSPAS